MVTLSWFLDFLFDIITTLPIWMIFGIIINNIIKFMFLLNWYSSFESFLPPKLMFLATLGALHSTPVSKSFCPSAEFQTSVSSRRASLFSASERGRGVISWGKIPCRCSIMYILRPKDAPNSPKLWVKGRFHWLKKIINFGSTRFPYTVCCSCSFCEFIFSFFLFFSIDAGFPLFSINAAFPFLCLFLWFWPRCNPEYKNEYIYRCW